MNLLENILWERIQGDDSEDGKGNKVYIKERCPLYKQLIQDIEKKKVAAD